MLISCAIVLAVLATVAWLAFLVAESRRISAGTQTSALAIEPLEVLAHSPLFKIGDRVNLSGKDSRLYYDNEVRVPVTYEYLDCVQLMRYIAANDMVGLRDMLYKWKRTSLPPGQEALVLAIYDYELPDLAGYGTRFIYEVRVEDGTYTCFVEERFLEW